MKKYIHDILFLGIFFFACAIFFNQTFRSGKLPVPTDTLVGLYHPWRDLYASTNPRGLPYKNFLITDPIRQQIPWRKLVIDEWKQGKLPVWNPYTFVGNPLLANVQSGAFYPLNILFFLLPFPIAWTILIMLQPVMGGLFLYLFLRHKEIHPVVAIVGSIAWAFSGFFIAWLTWGTIDQTVLWLPLILLSVDHVLTSNLVKRVLWTIFLALSLIFAIFAGHIQVALYILAFATAYALFALKYAANKQNIRWLCMGVVIALGLSAIQWVPTMQMLGQSARLVDGVGWLKEGWFLPWQHLVQFITPDFFGNPATLNYWGVWNYGEFIGYIGILPLIFACYSLIVRKDRLARFFQLSALIIFLFLLPTPIAKVAYQLHVPILASLQPTRLMAILDFCLVILAVLGFDYYIRNTNKKIFYGIAGMLLIIIFMWGYILVLPHTTHDIQFLENLATAKRNLYFPTVLWFCSSIVVSLFLFAKKFQRKIVFSLVIVLVSFDMFRFGWKFTPFTPVSYFFPTTKAISFLQAQQKPFRVMSLDNRILPPNVSAYYGLETPEGYDPIYDARYEEFVAALNRKKPNIQAPFGFNRIITISNIESPLFPLLNVKYVLSLDDIKNPDVELVFTEGQTKIYSYKKALPRIYPVEDIMVIHAKQEVFDQLYKPIFNPLKQAIVEDDVTVPKAPLDSLEYIGVVSVTSSDFFATSMLTNDHFVVLGNSYAPGWRAYIDSVETRIYRANYIFQGIIVPRGVHKIHFQYHI